ncbi:MAG TPA: P1 family peptidase [Gemmatimonadales bacterium]|nr:P1 family peptidase [Gemmatimonadales bacterium]
MKTPFLPALTAVSGITVGHWTHPSGGTGCTVILSPKGGMRAAAAIRGRATGTREFDALAPRHLVPHIDAVLLTGGSAYGLGAADGVMRWLREHGRGLPVSPTQVVPIVPAAVIFDLPADGAARWPRADDAFAACEAAGTAVAEGSVGAGAGATVGKVTGLEHAMKGGLGTWAARVGDVVVSALVVVNALGDVRGPDGRILAGARGADGKPRDGQAYLAEGGALFGRMAQAVSNTTLAVVATNVEMDRVALEELGRVGCDALARRITPYGTLFDGDICFGLSTAEVQAKAPLQVESLVATVMATALERAVRMARGTADVPGLADQAQA